MEFAVRNKSPAPATSKKVSFLAPKNSPNLAISTKPLLINAALAFSPRFNPSQIPAAIAITFLYAPATSTP